MPRAKRPAHLFPRFDGQQRRLSALPENEARIADWVDLLRGRIGEIELGDGTDPCRSRRALTLEKGHGVGIVVYVTNRHVGLGGALRPRLPGSRARCVFDG